MEGGMMEENVKQDTTYEYNENPFAQSCNNPAL